MGYGDYGTLLPGSQSYKNPRGMLDAGIAEGAKRAAYLSSMDQFYAQLDESTREFDKMYGLKEREVALGERHDAWAKDLSFEELGLKGELGRDQLDLEERLGYAKINLGRDQLGRQSSYQDSMVDLGQSRLDFDIAQAAKETGVYETYGADIMDIALHGRKSSAGKSQSPGLTPESLGIHGGEYYDYGQNGPSSEDKGYDPTGFYM